MADTPVSAADFFRASLSNPTNKFLTEDDLFKPLSIDKVEEAKRLSRPDTVDLTQKVPGQSSTETDVKQVPTSAEVKPLRQVLQEAIQATVDVVEEIPDPVRRVGANLIESLTGIPEAGLSFLSGDKGTGPQEAKRLLLEFQAGRDMFVDFVKPDEDPSIFGVALETVGHVAGAIPAFPARIAIESADALKTWKETGDTSKIRNVMLTFATIGIGGAGGKILSGKMQAAVRKNLPKADIPIFNRLMNAVGGAIGFSGVAQSARTIESAITAEDGEAVQAAYQSIDWGKMMGEALIGGGFGARTSKVQQEFVFKRKRGTGKTESKDKPETQKRLGKGKDPVIREVEADFEIRPAYEPKPQRYKPKTTLAKNAKKSEAQGGHSDLIDAQKRFDDNHSIFKDAGTLEVKPFKITGSAKGQLGPLQGMVEEIEQFEEEMLSEGPGRAATVRDNTLGLYLDSTRAMFEPEIIKDIQENGAQWSVWTGDFRGLGSTNNHMANDPDMANVYYRTIAKPVMDFFARHPSLVTRGGFKSDESITFIRKPLSEIKEEYELAESESAKIAEDLGIKSWPRKDSAEPEWPMQVYGSQDIIVDESGNFSMVLARDDLAARKSKSIEQIESDILTVLERENANGRSTTEKAGIQNQRSDEAGTDGSLSQRGTESGETVAPRSRNLANRTKSEQERSRDESHRKSLNQDQTKSPRTEQFEKNGVEVNENYNPNFKDSEDAANHKVDIIRDIPDELSLETPEIFGATVFDVAKRFTAYTKGNSKLYRKWLGVFSSFKDKQEPGWINVRDIKAIATLAHELSHGFHHKMSGMKFRGSVKGSFAPEHTEGFKENIDLRAELKEVSIIMRPLEGGIAAFGDYRNSYKELIADFLSAYMIDPNWTRSKAPKMTTVIESVLNDHPEIRNGIAEIHESRNDKTFDLGGVLQEIQPNRDTRIVSGVEGTVIEKTNDYSIRRVRVPKAQVAVMNSKLRPIAEKFTSDERQYLGAAIDRSGNVTTGETAEEVAAIVEANPEMRKAVIFLKGITEEARGEANENVRFLPGGEWITYLANYLPHFVAGKKSDIVDFATKWAKKTGQTKKRTLPTLDDVVEAGLVPISQDPVVLLQMWASINFRVSANLAYIEGMKNMEDETGQPVLVKPSEAPEGWNVYHHPAIARSYAKKNKNGSITVWEGGAAVHPDIEPFIKHMTELRDRSDLVMLAEAISGRAKTMALMASMFHHFTLTESAQAVLARGGHPLRGIMMSNKDPILGGFMREFQVANAGAMPPHKVGLMLTRHPEMIQDLVLAGVQIGTTSDVQLNLIQKDLVNLRDKMMKAGIPGQYMVKKINDFLKFWDTGLWDHYHTGLKAVAYYDSVAEILMTGKKDGSSFTPVEVRAIKETVGSSINDAFGGQEWDTMFWLTPKWRQASQLAMLAPDWTLSNINIATKSMGAFGNVAMSDDLMKKLPDSVRKKMEGLDSDERRKMAYRYWRNMFMTYGAVVIGANYALNGHAPWENEIDKRMDIEVTPIYNAVAKKLPWLNIDTNRRRYVRPGKQFREVVGWTTHPHHVLGSKIGPLVRLFGEQLFSHGAGSGFPMPWVQEDLSGYDEIISRAGQASSNFVPFSLGDNQFAFALPLSKGMSKWKAVRYYEDLIKAQVDPTFANTLKFRGDRTALIPWPATLATIAAEVKQGGTGEGFGSITDDEYDEKKLEIDHATTTNGHDAEKLFRFASAGVKRDFYTKFWKSMDKGDMTSAEHYARMLVNMGVREKGKTVINAETTRQNIISSATARGIEPSQELEQVLGNIE